MNRSATSPSPTRSLRRLLTATALTLGIAFSAVATTTSSASAASFGDVFVVATAHSNCGSHTITVWPMTNEYVNGQYGVYSYAQVYDYVSGRWITTNWMLGNGIQGHVFYNMRSFYAYAKVTYGRYMNGGWVYRADWVLITPDLDSQGVFCNA